MSYSVNLNQTTHDYLLQLNVHIFCHEWLQFIRAACTVTLILLVPCKIYVQDSANKEVLYFFLN